MSRAVENINNESGNYLSLTDTPINLELINWARDDRAGAVATFLGLYTVYA